MTQLAEEGWVVRHTFLEGVNKPAVRFFVCGLDTSEEAEAAIRQYPGVELKDRVDAVRRLSAAEITSLQIEPGEIRAWAP